MENTNDKPVEDLVYLINLKDVAEDQPIRTKAITKRLFEAHTKIKAQWLDEWLVVDEDPNKVDETTDVNDIDSYAIDEISSFDPVVSVNSNDTTDVIINTELPQSYIIGEIQIDSVELKDVEIKTSFIPKKKKPEFSKPKKERKQRIKANQNQ